MMLDDVLPRKEGFLDDKNVVYHSQKIVLSKGVDQWF